LDVSVLANLRQQKKEAAEIKLDSHFYLSGLRRNISDRLDLGFFRDE
jgi:hypothetical protein